MLTTLFIVSLALCVFISVTGIAAGITAALRRNPAKIEDPVSPDRLTIVIVTVASDNVWDTLTETINHTLSTFSKYDVHVLADEDSDRLSDLRARADITTHAVPDSFNPEHATGKGRALEWFSHNHTEEDHWYAFLDDDNRVLDKTFLYEIPEQEKRGRRAMNPVLIPRRGNSIVPFVLDHVRTLFDLTVYRAATGSGYPIFGLHGELLTVRGDVLSTIGFDRDTIAEDFAFADALYDNGVKTWQSATKVSILSPHTLHDFVQQRRRWTVGQFQAVRDATWATRSATVALHGTWTLGLLTNWFLGGVYFLTTPSLAPIHVWVIGAIGAVAYTLTYVTGLYRANKRWLLLSPTIPIIATIEHVLPWVIGVLELSENTEEFEVINK